MISMSGICEREILEEEGDRRRKAGGFFDDGITKVALSVLVSGSPILHRREG